MSKAKLKKYLQTLSKEQVIEVMLELYDARKEAKDYLEFYLTPDSNAELEKCKKAIRQEFFPNLSEVKARPELRGRPDVILHRTRV